MYVNPINNSIMSDSEEEQAMEKQLKIAIVGESSVGKVDRLLLFKFFVISAFTDEYYKKILSRRIHETVQSNRRRGFLYQTHCISWKTKYNTQNLRYRRSRIKGQHAG